MTFLLSTNNVLEYLVTQEICTKLEPEPSEIELKEAKNFNLLLSWQSGRQLLVKQERINREGKTMGEFFNEWRLQELLQQFSELNNIRRLTSEVLHFNKNHSIIVFNYLDKYFDLTDLYTQKEEFPTVIASSIGKVLSTIHRKTYKHQEYQDFFLEDSDDIVINEALHLSLGLEQISPEIFGHIPADGIKFLVLYQRYDSLGKAILDLSAAFDPCCVTHNDLKLNNILLHNNWEQDNFSQDEISLIRFIDWERSSWGDPASDLGTVISSYLQFWLGSLVVSKSININESLSLAVIPLEKIQPSITAVTQAYFDNFPEIIQHRPDFLKRVVQFAGLALINRIQAMLHYEKSFGNAGICMLQVAKSLLCRPEQSIYTVFGVTEAELTDSNFVLA
jgi:thiamine kinase-like enzyme